jgi:DNA-binding phage protein
MKSRSRSNHEKEIERLRKDRDTPLKFAAIAVDSLNDPRKRGAGLLALRSLAETFRGLNAVASNAGIRPSTLRRALSVRGNPRMKVIEAILRPLGLRLSVVPQPKKARKRTAKKPAKALRAGKAA